MSASIHEGVSRQFSDVLPWTGERFVPGVKGLIACEHLHRYRLAASHVSGRVLDVACGEGYGSALLAESADVVFGVDVNASVVRAASSNYDGQNLKFICADGVSLPFEGGQFDWVISFETIEHVTNPAAFLAELRRVLKPEGCLIISSPNALVGAGSVSNPFHIKEFTLEEFHNLISESFPCAEFWDQFSVVGSMMLSRRDSVVDFSSRYDLFPRKDAVAINSPLTYTLAFASQREVPIFDANFFADDGLVFENHVGSVDGKNKVSSLRLGRILDFTLGGDGDLVTKAGFGEPEPGGTWTIATDALLRFRLVDSDISGARLKILFNRFSKAPGALVVVVNGVQFFSDVDDGGVLFIDISCGMIPMDNMIELRLEMKGAKSPFEMGVSDDRRKLGINLKSIEIIGGGQ